MPTNRLTPFKLERYFAPREFTAPFLLCASDCESIEVGELLDLVPGAAERFRTLRLGYTESVGSPELRQQIAGLYERMGPEEILVHAGATEAIFTFMYGVLRAGDHAVLHYPGYQALSEVAASTGCDVSFWHARRERGWALDVDELRRLIRPNTRVIVLNCPHNPTGHLMDRASFDEVVAIARRQGALLFSDEAYRGLEFGPAPPLPAACDVYERGVSLGVLSKTFGLPGLRIGWLASRDAQALREAAWVKDYTTICSSAPSEFLATVALTARRALVERSLAIIRANLPLVREFFGAHADRFDWTEPQAGPVAYPSLRNGEDADRFCDAVLEGAGVLLLPGTVFDPASREFRVGFGRRTMPEALARLDRFLRR